MKYFIKYSLMYRSFIKGYQATRAIYNARRILDRKWIK